MKKTVAFCALVLFLSSCSLFGNSDNNTNTNIGPSIVQKTGIVRSKSISLQSSGTHNLELSDGTMIALESKVVSLSDYLDQKVSVEGVLKTTNSTDILDVSSVSLDTLNGNTNDSVLTLFQYDGPLGFSFRYSSLFTLETPSDTEVVLFLTDTSMLENASENTPVITIKLLDPKPTNLKNWIKDSIKVESVTLQIGNKIGERLVGKSENVSIYVMSDNLYEITFSAPGGKQDTLVKNKFYEMLDTFVWGASSETDNKNNNSLFVENMNENVFVSNTNTNQKNMNENSKPYTGEVSAATDDIKASVMQYISQNLNDLRPIDDTITGTVKASKFEFASPDYVYVEFSDGVNKRKLLLKYFREGSTVKVSQIGYFAPGETKDWETKTGSNEAASSAREVYNADGSKVADIEQGMRLYQNATVKYSLQYPANWYYAGTPPTEEGAIHQVNFGDKPLDSSPAKVSVIVFKGSFSSLGISDTTVETADTTSIYVEKGDKVYKITGSADQRSVIEKIGQTISTQ